MGRSETDLLIARRAGEPRLFALDQLPDDGLVAFRTVDFRESTVRIAALRKARTPTAAATGELIVVYVAESTEKRTALAREIMKGIVFPQLFVVPLMVVLM